MKTVADNPVQRSDRYAIEDAVRLPRRRVPIDQVILLGSKAMGSDTPESDLDLLILTTTPLSWRERDAITDALFDIELAHGAVISTLVAQSDEWLAGRYSVRATHSEIERHGIAA